MNNLIITGSLEKHKERLRKYWHKFGACEECGVAAGEACLAINSLPRYRSVTKWAHKSRIDLVKQQKQMKLEAKKHPKQNSEKEEWLAWFAARSIEQVR